MRGKAGVGALLVDVADLRWTFSKGRTGALGFIAKDSAGRVEELQLRGPLSVNR